MVLGQRPYPGASGIAGAVRYWCLQGLYPAASGRHRLETPMRFKGFAFSRLGLGGNPQPSAVPHSGFRAFVGGGRRRIPGRGRARRQTGGRAERPVHVRRCLRTAAA